MKNIKFVILISYLAYANCMPAIIIKEYEEFLKSTIDGQPSEYNGLGNAWENSGKFQGDIVLNDEQIKSFVDDFSGNKNAIVNPAKLWPDNTVYYNIEESHFDEQQIKMIEDAVSDLARLSCLRFLKKTDENQGYINVRGEKGGCFSSVGYNGKRIKLNLTPGPNCFVHGSIQHEFLHALGFYHMQCSTERNDWIKINWLKIRWGMYRNFYRYSENKITNLGEEYDYGSVMHYSEYAFSVDGSKTIIPLKPTNATLGQVEKMSEGDIIRLNKLYKCPGFV